MGQDTEDVFQGRPAIHETPIVRDLHLVGAQAGDKMEVLCAPHFAQNDIVPDKVTPVEGLNGAQLAALDQWDHGVPTGAEADRFPLKEFRDIGGGPGHIELVLCRIPLPNGHSGLMSFGFAKPDGAKRRSINPACRSGGLAPRSFFPKGYRSCDNSACSMHWRGTDIELLGFFTFDRVDHRPSSVGHDRQFGSWSEDLPETVGGRLVQFEKRQAQQTAEQRASRCAESLNFDGEPPRMVMIKDLRQWNFRRLKNRDRMNLGQ